MFFGQRKTQFEYRFGELGSTGCFKVWRTNTRWVYNDKAPSENNLNLSVASWKKLISRVVTYKARPKGGNHIRREGSPVPGVELFDPSEGNKIACFKKFVWFTKFSRSWSQHWAHVDIAWIRRARCACQRCVALRWRRRLEVTSGTQWFQQQPTPRQWKRSSQANPKLYQFRGWSI